MPRVSVQNLNKDFKIYERPQDRLYEIILRKQRHQLYQRQHRQRKQQHQHQQERGRARRIIKVYISKRDLYLSKRDLYISKRDLDIRDREKGREGGRGRDREAGQEESLKSTGKSFAS